MPDYYFDIETTGLNPFEHQTLTIQMKTKSEIVVWKLWAEKDEVSLIEGFLQYLGSIGRYNSICGYNCLQFDLPFIASRLTIHGVMDRTKYQTLYNRNWIDLYQYLGGNYVSMDKWLRHFGLKRSYHFTGAHVPLLFKEKRYAEIEEHATEDLVLCEKLAVTLNTSEQG